ncbi:MAG: type IV pilus assembly protein PilM [Parcubacteria group bacterium Gr01-1014_73]|nr:MAG: type IV pilus assembly protein PilM [Parcubacteria group bacterium Gr01-1014_73]
MITNGFLKYFPAPRFLAQPAVGLAISDQAVRFVLLKHFDDGGLKPIVYGERELPTGAVLGGDVAKAKEIIEILKELKKDWPTSYAAVSVPEEKAFLLKTEVPLMAEKYIRGNLDLHLEEFVPIVSREAVFDFELIGPSKVKADSLDVGVAVLPQKIVSHFVDVLAAAGIKPLSLEIEPQAVARALIHHNDKRTILVINFGGVSTGLAIVGRNVVQYSSTLNIGGNAFSAALRKSIATAGGEIGGNIEKFSSLLGTLSVLRDEVNRLLAYWKEHRLLVDGVANSADDKIESIILCGRDSNINGFRAYVGANVNLPVTVGNVWANAFSFDEYVPPIQFHDSLGYAAAIGSALRRPIA